MSVQEDLNGRKPRQIFLAEMLRRACEIDVLAIKPGNVSIRSSGHGMSADDFLASANAILGPISRTASTVGERIFESIAATRSVVGCNTNLGIVLLCAPLTHAVLAMRAGQSVQDALRECLDTLSVEDANRAYEAIRLAQPGGLGRRSKHDVAESATVDLRSAMAAARETDLVARQYANGFEDVLGVQPIIEQLRRRWNDEPWVATAVYLELLARNPDSHVARKHGMEEALRVSHQAHALARSVLQSADPREFERELSTWDALLKQQNINPGTTADLTVTSFYMNGILSIPDLELTASGAFSPPMANQPWEQSRILAN